MVADALQVAEAPFESRRTIEARAAAELERLLAGAKDRVAEDRPAAHHRTRGLGSGLGGRRQRHHRLVRDLRGDDLVLQLARQYGRERIVLAARGEAER